MTTFHETILAQLGGNRFLVMTGAHSLAYDNDERSLSMRVGRNDRGVTHVRITLDDSDTYSLDFLRIRGAKVSVISAVTLIFADQLRAAFTSGTGLDVSL